MSTAPRWLPAHRYFTFLRRCCEHWDEETESFSRVDIHDPFKACGDNGDDEEAYGVDVPVSLVVSVHVVS